MLKTKINSTIDNVSAPPRRWGWYLTILNIYLSHFFIIILFRMKLGKTELCISNSKSIDRKKLVQVDKKYAVMTTVAQRQVTTELECKKFVIKNSWIIWWERKRGKIWRSRNWNRWRNFIRNRGVIKEVILILRYRDLGKIGRKKFLSKERKVRRNLRGLIKWERKFSMTTRNNCKKCFSCKKKWWKKDKTIQGHQGQV